MNKMRFCVDKQNSEKFDFNVFINKYQISDIELFKSYLTEIWLDLRLRSDYFDRGVNKNTFSKVSKS